MSRASTPLSNSELETIRLDFPILQTRINGYPLVYLDNAASAQKPRQMVEALSSFYLKDYANIHRGVHQLSQRATEAFENARETVRSFINAAESREIIFVRGATEGVNLVAHGWARTQLKAGQVILISALEHHANIVPWQIAAQQTGATVKVIPMDDCGVLDQTAYAQLLTSDVSLVALSFVSNALGTINPAKEMIAQAHAKNIPVLLDAAQAIPHFDIDVQDLDVDFLVFSGHKLYGPTGTGVLYGKADRLNALPPYQSGGDMIEHVRYEASTYKETPSRFEAGTPHIAGFVGLAASIKYLQNLDRKKLLSHEAWLLKKATAALESLPGLRIVGTAPNKASVVSFLIEGVHPHDLGTILDAYGIAVRTGHHCCEPLMQRLGITGTVRASFAFYNTEAEINQLASAIQKACKLLLA
jgi:cysteine desulfurase/selenocysteine lyase